VSWPANAINTRQSPVVHPSSVHEWNISIWHLFHYKCFQNKIVFIFTSQQKQNRPSNTPYAKITTVYSGCRGGLKLHQYTNPSLVINMVQNVTTMPSKSQIMKTSISIWLIVYI
jgi:hypothetical protein